MIHCCPAKQLADLMNIPDAPRWLAEALGEVVTISWTRIA